jgi:hypothetical protein
MRFAVDAQHRRSDDLGRAAIDRRIVSSCLKRMHRQRNTCRQGESFPLHGTE